MNRVNVNELNNEELFSVLSSVGLNAGPVTDTTRKVYEKRLLNYLSEKKLDLDTMLNNGSRTSAASSSSTYSLAQLRKLNDAELYALLKEKGIKAGPVTSSTRQLYERRLMSCLNGEQQEQEQDENNNNNNNNQQQQQHVADVSKMSEKELFDHMKRLGLDPGPITKSNRSLYEKKLNKYLSSSTSANAPAATAAEIDRRSIDRTLTTPVNNNTTSTHSSHTQTYNESGYESMMNVDPISPIPRQPSPTQQPSQPSSSNGSIYPNLSSFMTTNTAASQQTQYHYHQPQQQQQQPPPSLIKTNSTRRTSDRFKTVRFEDEIHLNDENNNNHHDNSDIFVLNQQEQEQSNQESSSSSSNNNSRFSFSKLFAATEKNYFDRYAKNLQNMTFRRPIHDNSNNKLINTTNINQNGSKINYFSASLNPPLPQYQQQRMNNNGYNYQQQQPPYLRGVSYTTTATNYAAATNNDDCIYRQRPPEEFYPRSILKQSPPKPPSRMAIMSQSVRNHVRLAGELFAKGIRYLSTSTFSYVILFLVITTLVYVWLLSLTPPKHSNPIIDF